MLSTVANNTYAYIDHNPPATGYYQIRIVNPTACNPSVRGINSVISNTVDKNGKIINVVTLTALYPLITIILAMLLLKEHIQLKQILGIFLALIAIVLLAS